MKRIVITGVENSGKTTLVKELAKRLNTPFILELCRENLEVLAGTETTSTLIELNKLQETLVQDILSSNDFVICDTAGLELEIWSKSKFDKEIKCETLVPVDLYFFCNTLPIWEEDPLRAFPKYEDRKQHELLFIDKYREMGKELILVPAITIEERVEFVVEQLKERNAFVW